MTIGVSVASLSSVSIAPSSTGSCLSVSTPSFSSSSESDDEFSASQWHAWQMTPPVAPSCDQQEKKKEKRFYEMIFTEILPRCWATNTVCTQFHRQRTRAVPLVLQGPAPPPQSRRRQHYQRSHHPKQRSSQTRARRHWHYLQGFRVTR